MTRFIWQTRATYDVVGPICESGDFLAKNREIQKVENEDYIAVLDVGAYGMAMGSSYNMRGRAAEILVENQRTLIIRRREDYHSLVQPMIASCEF